MTEGGVKRGQLRLSQARHLSFRIVQIETEQMVLPALVHIRMLYCYVVHGDYLKAEMDY